MLCCLYNIIEYYPVLSEISDCKHIWPVQTDSFSDQVGKFESFNDLAALAVAVSVAAPESESESEFNFKSKTEHQEAGPVFVYLFTLGC